MVSELESQWKYMRHIQIKILEEEEIIFKRVSNRSEWSLEEPQRTVQGSGN